MTTTERGLFERIKDECATSITAKSLHVQCATLEMICNEIEQRLAEAEQNTKNWSIHSFALQRLIWNFCYSEIGLEDITGECAHHTKMLKEKADKIAQLEGVVAEKNNAIAWALSCIDNQNNQSPKEFVDSYHGAEKAIALTAGQPEAGQLQPVDPALMEPFKKEMKEKTIPAIIDTVHQRQRNAAEFRGLLNEQPAQAAEPVGTLQIHAASFAGAPEENQLIRMEILSAADQLPPGKYSLYTQPRAAVPDDRFEKLCVLLRTHNIDEEGYEVGLCRVRFDRIGRPDSVLWMTQADIDAAVVAVTPSRQEG